MADFYQIILECEHLNPLRFWIGIIMLFGIVVSVIIVLRKRNKKQKKTTIIEPSQKQPALTKSGRTIQEIGGAVSEKKIKYNQSLKSKLSDKLEPASVSETNNKISNSSASGLEPVVTLKPKVKVTKTTKAEVEFKRVNYDTPKNFNQKNPYKYPVALFPEFYTPIKDFGTGRNGRVGKTENSFRGKLIDFFGKSIEVHANVHVVNRNASKAYEPDFALIYSENDIHVNIDIEIDEPYDGYSRMPLHVIGEDIWRDKFFIKRGWIVIRFAEIQICKEPEMCCEYIANILRTITPQFSIKTDYGFNLDAIPQWSSLQAKKWALDNYREKYLDIESFGFVENIEEGIVTKQTDENKVFEKLIIEDKVPSSPVKGKLEKENSVTRDQRLKFDSKRHRYYIDKNPDTLSVSSLVSSFFPEFDIGHWAPIKAAEEGITVEEKIEEWKRNGEEKSNLGTELHEQIENFYNDKYYVDSTPEFGHFKSFIEQYPTMEPYRSEWRVFDEELLLAGTIDMVYIKPNGDLYLFDWKRSEKVVDFGGNIQNNDYQTGLGGLEHLGDNSFNKYSIQVNLYKRILEKNYNVVVSSMNLLILHEKYAGPYRIEIPLMDAEVNYIFNARKRNLV
jgi:hypothetical protein